MSDATHLDQADEDILSYEVSDETLEAAARGAEAIYSLSGLYDPGSPCDC